MHETEYLSRKNLIALTQEVREYLKSLSWFKRYVYEVFICVFKLALFAGGIWIFSFPGLWNKILILPVLSFLYASISITGIHETGHRAFVKWPLLNKILGYFFADFWTGKSSLWFHYHHCQEHHTYTNVPQKEEQFIYYPWMNAYVYFFGLPYLILFWFFYRSIKFLWEKWLQLAIYLVLAIAGYALNIYLFSLFVPLGWAIFWTFAMRLLFVPVFLQLTIFNHIDLDLLDKLEPWLPHQSKTTRNIKKTWFFSWIGGNSLVDCHIEHHIFPALSQAMLAKVHPIIEKYLQREGYKYVEDNYWKCLRFCLKNYDKIFLVS